jgi:hypothetical protein
LKRRERTSRVRRDEASTEELSWNIWVGRRPGESGPPSYPISAETAEPRRRVVRTPLRRPRKTG